MAVTLTSSGLQFPNGTEQTTAAASASTDWGGVGSYAVCYYAGGTPSVVTGGSTIAGSSLRYASTNGYSLGIETSGYSTYYMLGTKMGAVTLGNPSLSGTWRCMVDSTKAASTTTAQLFVRIS